MSAWKRVVGSKSHQQITAGFTPAQPALLGKGQFGDKIPLEDAMQKIHDANKVLFFSSMQLCVLNAPYLLNLLLWGDYGTGK